MDGLLGVAGVILDSHWIIVDHSLILGPPLRGWDDPGNLGSSWANKKKTYVVSMSTYLYIYLTYIYLYLCIYLSIYRPIYLSTYLSIFLSIYLSMYLSIYLSIYLYHYIYHYNPFPLLLNVPQILETRVHLPVRKISDWPI